MSERTEVIVVGGGQAGLTAGYYLRQSGIVSDSRCRAAKRAVLA
jgi:cation diffusion facilitator CzcD-associated flavoprotein CzcO